jgi:hypothetical protein
MEQDFRMIENDEHGGFSRLGFCNTLIQGIITGHSGKNLIQEVV